MCYFGVNERVVFKGWFWVGKKKESWKSKFDWEKRVFQLRPGFGQWRVWRIGNVTESTVMFG